MGSEAKQKIPYTKPEIVDYGSVRELTAGCNGEPKDFQGKNNAISVVTSRGICTSTP